MSTGQSQPAQKLLVEIQPTFLILCPPCPCHLHHHRHLRPEDPQTQRGQGVRRALSSPSYLTQTFPPYQASLRASCSFSSLNPSHPLFLALSLPGSPLRLTYCPEGFQFVFWIWLHLAKSSAFANFLSLDPEVQIQCSQVGPGCWRNCQFLLLADPDDPGEDGSTDQQCRPVLTAITGGKTTLKPRPTVLHTDPPAVSTAWWESERGLGRSWS